MVLYKLLNTKHSSYDPIQIRKMCLLYEGGYSIMEDANLFMKKLSIESGNSYKERLQCAAYLPYLSQFIDNFASSLFSDDLLVKEAADADDEDTLGGTVENEDFYKVFASNCDLMNNSFHNFMKDTFTEALYSKCAFVGVDFMKVTEDEKPQNLLEEEAMGASRAYLYYIDPMTVIDHKCDHSSEKFMWVKLRNDKIIQDDPLVAPMKQVEFKIWTMNGQVAHWALYQSKPMKLDREFRDSDDIPLVDEGETSFGEIPIFKLKVPSGLHLGDKLGPVCEELFQRRSFLVSNMNKTCIAIPAVFLGPEINAPDNDVPSEIQTNPNRAGAIRMQLSNQGYTVLGSEDKLEIKEAHGHSHALVDKQLVELREQMHQVVHQMAQSVTMNKQAAGRSASSKQEDRHSTEILLTAYARVVKDFVKEVYQCISNARGESIIWSIQGLSTFVEEQRETIIAEMTAVAGTQPILSMFPSPTFQKKYLLRMGMAMIGSASPEEEATIQEELEAAVDSGKHQELMPGMQSDDAEQKPAPQSQSAHPDNSVEPKQMGPGGQALLPDGSHLQTGQHVDSQVVHEQLAQDYEEKDIQFVLHIPWIGPVEVPLTSIDFSNKDNWQASVEPEKVDKFADKMANEQFSKPIILVNNPSNDNKMMVVDGHHRALAALQNGQPISAYVGQVGSNSGPWEKLHSKQVGSKQASISSNQKEITKEVSNQVDKSAKAVRGKTK